MAAFAFSDKANGITSELATGIGLPLALATVASGSPQSLKTAHGCRTYEPAFELAIGFSVLHAIVAAVRDQCLSAKSGF